MKACVLAGGLGTRLRSLVSSVPKPLASIYHRPFIEYVLDHWIAQKVTSFYLLTGYLGHVIEEHFQGSYRGCEVKCLQEPKALGTGGALSHAFRANLDFEEGFVLNGDTFFEVDAQKLKAFHDEKNAEITLALREVQVNDRYSPLSLSEEGRVLDFMKRVPSTQKGLINGGVYFLSSKGVEAIRSFPREVFSIEDDFFPDYLKIAPLYGLNQKARFIDIGVPSDYERAPHFFSSYVSH